MKSQYYETEQILFKYFKYIKANKYFSAPLGIIKRNPEITHSDISNALYNSKLNDDEFDIICDYGMRQHAPKIRGTNAYTIWLNGICLIQAEFKNRGWL